MGESKEHVEVVKLFFVKLEGSWQGAVFVLVTITSVAVKDTSYNQINPFLSLEPLSYKSVIFYELVSAIGN